MNGFYELVELASGNVVGDYATEDEALDVLRRADLLHGLAAVEGYALMRGDDSGTSELIAADDALIRLALRYQRQPVD